MALKWGVASAGLISHDFLTSLATLSPDDHKVVAVAARDAKRAQDFATLHKIPKVYSSYAELAKDPNIEIVYVGTIIPYHFEITKLMLEHGKHVLCEKSFTLREKDTTALIKLAKEKNLFLMEAIWSRFFPAYEYIRKEIKAGTIGDVVQINANFGVYTNVGRMKLKDLGGGTILDLGVYCLQLVVMIFGAKLPSEVKTVGHVNDSGADDSAVIGLTYPGGRTAALTTSTLTTLKNHAYIYGTKGTIKLTDPFHCTTKVVITHKSTDCEVKTVREFPLPPASHPLNFGNNSIGLRYEADEVRRCIRSGLIECPLMTHEESITIAKLEETIHNQLGVYFT